MTDSNNELNKKVLGILGTLDKEKIEKATKMVQNMSREDLSNLAKMFGIKPNNNN